MLSSVFADDELTPHLEPHTEGLNVLQRPPKLRKTETLVREENAAIGLLRRAVEMRKRYSRNVTRPKAPLRLPSRKAM